MITFFVYARSGTRAPKLLGRVHLENGMLVSNHVGLKSWMETAFQHLVAEHGIPNDANAHRALAEQLCALRTGPHTVVATVPLS